MSAKDIIEAAPEAPELQQVRLRGGHVVEIASSASGATLRVGGAEDPGGVEIEIRWSSEGPVARVRAARIDVATTADVNVRCKSFQVETTDRINLRAGGSLEASAQAVDLEARAGRIVARANDDVQLLGEEILLNCDRTPEIPEWVTQAPGIMMGELLSISDESGDAELVADVRGQETEKGHAPR